MLNEISKMTSINNQSRIKYYKIILQIYVRDAGPADSYHDDSEWKGKAADHTIQIPGRLLDMVAIKIWWRNFKDRAKNCLLDTNGCTVIYEALRAGGAANYVDIPHNPLGTPASLKTYALKLKRSMEGP
jgi:hypothetical protein